VLEPDPAPPPLPGPDMGGALVSMKSAGCVREAS
jgi:hypothetical protein